MQTLRRRDKATPALIRLTNTHLVLQGVSEGRGLVSRADLVRLTRLNTATISSVVGGLINDGLIIEVGVGPSAGGKPPVLLDLDERKHSVLAAQISHSGYQFAELTLRGGVIREEAGPWDGLEPIKVLQRKLSEFAVSERKIVGLGVAAPGLVGDEGVVTRSVRMGWHDVRLKDMLEGSVSCPIHVLNDSNATAFAEVALLDEKSPSLLALYIGDGVGAGLVLSGQLQVGERFAAGEVGHLNLRTHDEACPCGRRGCLEVVARVDAMLSAADPGGPASLNRSAARLAARNIAALLELNLELLDVGRTVICGPVCHLAPGLVDLVVDELRLSDAFQSGRITVDLSHLGNRGALLGAGAFAAHAELGLLLDDFVRQPS